MKFLSWLIVIALCLAIAGSLGWFKYSEIQTAIEQGKAFPEPVESVEVFVAQQTVFQPTTRVSAEVVATQTAELRNELAGRITRVGFAPGATVAKDELLIALDTSEESARLKAAKAEQEIARLALQRAERLVERGAGSVDDRDRARAQFDAASANVQTLQAVIAKRQLRAPFAATTSLHTLEAGQFLAANTLVAQLVGLSNASWIDFALPQQQAGLIAGEFVEVLQNDQLIGRARIIARDASINASSRNLSFRALLEPAEGAANVRLFPGMLLSVQVSLGDLEPVVAVPAAAIRRNSMGATVYVIDSGADAAGDNLGNEQGVIRARRRPVTLGSAIEFDTTTQQQMMVVTSGLAAGERVAANGAFKLRDGTRVNLIEGGPTALVVEGGSAAAEGSNSNVQN